MGLNLDIIVQFMNSCSYEVDLKIHPYFFLRKTLNRTFKVQQLLAASEWAQGIFSKITFLKSVRKR